MICLRIARELQSQGKFFGKVRENVREFRKVEVLATLLRILIENNNKDVLTKISFYHLSILGGGFSGKKESGQLRFGGKDRPFKRPLIPFNIRDKRDDSDSRDSYRERDYHSRDRYSDRYRSYKSSSNYDK